MLFYKVGKPIKISLGLLATLVWCSLSSASDDIRHRLMGFEWQLDDKVWLELAVDPTENLIILIRDPQEAAHIKARAIAALGLYPSQTVWDLYLELLDGSQLVARRRMVDVLCAAFATIKPAEVEALITPYIQDVDAHLRIRAARCLMTLATKSALASVDQYRAQLGLTDNAWELRALDQ